MTHCVLGVTYRLRIVSTTQTGTSGWERKSVMTSGKLALTNDGKRAPLQLLRDRKGPAGIPTVEIEPSDNGEEASDADDPEEDEPEDTDSDASSDSDSDSSSSSSSSSKKKKKSKKSNKKDKKKMKKRAKKAEKGKKKVKKAALKLKEKAKRERVEAKTAMMAARRQSKAETSATTAHGKVAESILGKASHVKLNLAGVMGRPGYVDVPMPLRTELESAYRDVCFIEKECQKVVDNNTLPLPEKAQTLKDWRPQLRYAIITRFQSKPP